MPTTYHILHENPEKSRAFAYYSQSINILNIILDSQIVKSFIYDSLNRMTLINGRTIQYQWSSLYPTRMITEDVSIEYTWEGNHLIEYKKNILVQH